MYTAMSQKEPLPPSVDDLLADRDTVHRRYPITFPYKWRTSCLPPSFFARFTGSRRPDTPSASFYRLYEFFVISWNVQFRNELEYFCSAHPDWAVADLPDPADPDPRRYVILACKNPYPVVRVTRRYVPIIVYVYKIYYTKIIIQ